MSLKVSANLDEIIQPLDVLREYTTQLVDCLPFGKLRKHAASITSLLEQIWSLADKLSTEPNPDMKHFKALEFKLFYTLNWMIKFADNPMDKSSLEHLRATTGLLERYLKHDPSFPHKSVCGQGELFELITASSHER